MSESASERSQSIQRKTPVELIRTSSLTFATFESGRQQLEDPTHLLNLLDYTRSDKDSTDLNS